MNQRKRLRLCYLLSAIMLFSFSATFLIMPAANMVSQQYARMVLVAVGMLFWISGICGYTLLFAVHRMIRRMGRKDGGQKRKGLFPANRVTLVLDIVFTGGVIFLITLSKKSFMQGYGAYVLIFITTMAFHLRLLYGSRPEGRIKYKGNNHGESVGAIKRDEKKDTRKEDADHE